jgi:hypothetical protein
LIAFERLPAGASTETVHCRWRGESAKKERKEEEKNQKKKEKKKQQKKGQIQVVERKVGRHEGGVDLLGGLPLEFLVLAKPHDTVQVARLNQHFHLGFCFFLLLSTAVKSQFEKGNQFNRKKRVRISKVEKGKQAPRGRGR